MLGYRTTRVQDSMTECSLKFLIYGESIFISFQDMKPPIQIQQGVCHTVALSFTF